MQKERLRADVLAGENREDWKQVDAGILRPNAGILSRDPAVSIGRTLLDQPRWLSAHLLYDSKGTELFEAITRLPEYYLTHCENEILESHAGDIIRVAEADFLIELGAGLSVKTRHLLSALRRERKQPTFVPVDVSLSALEASRDAIHQAYPGMGFVGLNSTYEQGLEALDPGVPKLFVFLGSTIGNLMRAELTQFLQRLSASMADSDFLLLGADRLKDPDLILKAYDDSQGITRQFILNSLGHLNQVTGARFERSKFEYRPEFNPDWHQMELYLEAREDHSVHLPALDLSVNWRRQERLLVEVSRKFDPDRLADFLYCHGLNVIEHLSDKRDWFSLFLLKKRAVEEVAGQGNS